VRLPVDLHLKLLLGAPMELRFLLLIVVGELRERVCFLFLPLDGQKLFLFLEPSIQGFLFSL